MPSRQRTTSPRSPRAKKPAKPPRGRAGWWVVQVDQRPLRRKTATECRRELTRLEKARAEWRRYDTEDRPAYERWMASHFGAALTELRDLEMALREKERLIDEVEIEYAWIGASSYRAAYLAVMRRRNAPVRTRTVPPEEAGPREPERPFAEFSEEEKHDVFEEFLEDMFDIDPAELSRREYQRMFREFQEHVRSTEEKSAPPPQQPGAALRPADARVKELYRVLVRRLHPDTRADGDPAVSALWHEVQEAYGAGNIERLEMLLALTDIRARSIGGHTSLFQMREVLAELRRSFLALQKSLRAARREPAWNFARRADREKVAAKLQRRFEADLAARRKRLRDREALIARWARPTKSRRGWDSELQVTFGFLAGE